ncbi:bifunctional serine/threonine-protein kinase/formylglycine-generating enzyme family protein [Mariniblastus fucicola]|uniref:bifunctional serine/threonine-protein kinase/formylglycine-generating enzyme family protein n=1 Tax=Mariniblastus fucicola TaxID=980251 RepID=UPI001AEFDD11|nr:bifunctional serine/threonine-protein kinase/formylglycine-generating enzyme family protein [Mariniblastus fucicola]
MNLKFSDFDFDCLRSWASEFLQLELDEKKSRQGSNHKRDSELGLNESKLNSLHECFECLALLDRVFPNESKAQESEQAILLIGEVVNDRYEISELIGRGGFGFVFKTRDLKLERSVALKVFNFTARSLASRDQKSLAMSEARTVAKLKHPNIVRVFDVGSTDKIPIFMVSELIDGQDLKSRVSREPLDIRTAVSIIAAIANALDYAHSQSLVHRDVKPANILIDKDGVPHLADFGLAVETSKWVRKAGTPYYMSPEQLNQNRHRIDPRSDIYSLGVTLYELLAGAKPFPSDSQSDLADRVCRGDFLPLSLLVEDFPLELERIQTKAMSLRQSDRYSTAAEMAIDLLDFLEGMDSQSKPNREPDRSNLVKIVPQGLRPFSSDDADFFLQLLPGVRDKAGMPRSIRFWKSKIEDAAFEVGVLFGPSGSGKSSFAKAGMLPSLDRSVHPVYVEATANDTAVRALNQLRNQVALPKEIDSLAKAIQYLCNDPEIQNSSGRFLIILDQFEQWLHERNRYQDSDLFAALEKCDGKTVMAMLMIRDDYWMDLNRLMSQLDIPIAEGKNSAAVDLFNLDHARYVLRLFGQANGDLPETDSLNVDHLQFIDRAIEELQTDNRVICVRLALFSQMMRGRKWSPETLQSMAGSSGVGVQFFEETFGERSTRSTYRSVAESAKSVLSVLLPNAGSQIKGTSKSAAELRLLTGLKESSVDELLLTLDQQLRLITPVQVDQLNHSDDSETGSVIQYQLAHDFLVPVLREWLFRKKRESPSGRAELCLEERDSLWKTDSSSRFLPSLSETIAINRLTHPKSWSPSQRTMMKSANRYYSIRGLTITGLMIAAMTAFFLVRSSFNQRQFATEAKGKVEALLSANPSDVPGLIEELAAYNKQSQPLLSDHFQSQTDQQKKLHAALGLQDADPQVVAFLQQRCLDATPEYAGLIRRRDEIFDPKFEEKLWSTIRQGSDLQILLSASALAHSSPDDENWKRYFRPVTAALVKQNPLNVIKWMELLQPVRKGIAKTLADRILSDSSEFTQPEYQVAQSVLQELAIDDPALLFRLLKQSDITSLPGFAEAFLSHGEAALEMVAEEIANYDTSQQLTGDNKTSETQRRSNVCLLAIKLGRLESVIPYLRNTIDNSVQTEIIHGVGEVAVEAEVFLNQLTLEDNSEVRASLLMCVGELFDQLTAAQKQTVLKLAIDWYEHDLDPGVHGACYWLIANQSQHPELIQQLRTIDSQLGTGQQEAGRQWYVSRSGLHKFAVIDSPPEFWMGSTTETAPNRDTDELRRKRLIPRSYAIGQFEVNVEQFGEFWRQRPNLREFYSYPETIYGEENNANVATRINWFMAAEYCNWLSEQEGIPEHQWCFPKDIDRMKGFVIPDDYLERTGYRLLSETEWEYACRNGALTTRFFGHRLERLVHYCWFPQNSGYHEHAPGQLKPNSLGLFDLYGNVREWTANGQPTETSPATVPAAMGYEDKLFFHSANDGETFILRGGGFDASSRYIRSGYRDGYTPDAGDVAHGFRIGRTMPPADSTQSRSPSE